MPKFYSPFRYFYFLDVLFSGPLLGLGSHVLLWKWIIYVTSTCRYILAKHFRNPLDIILYIIQPSKICQKWSLIKITIILLLFLPQYKLLYFVFCMLHCIEKESEFSYRIFFCSEKLFNKIFNEKYCFVPLTGKNQYSC